MKRTVRTPHTPARVALRWSRRLTAVAVLGSMGVAVAPAQSSAPVSAPPPPLAGTRGPDGGTEEYRLVASLKQASASSPSQTAALSRLAAGLDMPEPALRAYRFAEVVMQRADAACRLDWSLLAAIGHVESDHGRFGGAAVHADGTSTPRILGPRLNGSADTAAIADTDGGSLDGDTRWDRAVGPMQFIPSTWAVVGTDADGDGRRDPHDLDDAALSAAAYLCAGDADLGTTAGQRSAVYRYNHSRAYVDLVLRLAAAYAGSEASGLTLPAAATAPSDVPVLDRPVAGPAHPARPPRPGTQNLPAAVRRAVTSAVTTTRRDAASGTSARESGAAGAGGSGGGHTAVSTGDSSGPEGGDASGGTRKRDTATQTRTTDSGGDGATDGTSGGTGSTDGRDSGGTTDGGGSEGSGGTTDGSGGGGSTDGSASDGSDDSADGGGDSTGGQDTDSTVTGVLDRADDGSWWVGDRHVDLGDAAYLEAEALNDFDGVDGVESNMGELETLLSQEVTVVLDDGSDVVRTLNDLAYR